MTSLLSGGWLVCKVLVFVDPPAFRDINLVFDSNAAKFSCCNDKHINSCPGSYRLLNCETFLCDPPTQSLCCTEEPPCIWPCVVFDWPALMYLTLTWTCLVYCCFSLIVNLFFSRGHRTPVGGALGGRGLLLPLRGRTPARLKALRLEPIGSLHQMERLGEPQQRPTGEKGVFHI